MPFDPNKAFTLVDEDKPKAFDPGKPFKLVDEGGGAAPSPISYSNLLKADTAPLGTPQDVAASANAIRQKYEGLQRDSNPEQAQNLSGHMQQDLSALKERANKSGLPFDVVQDAGDVIRQKLAKKVEKASLTPEEMSALVGPKAAKVLTPIERGTAQAAGGMLDPENLPYMAMGEPAVAAFTGQMLTQAGIGAKKIIAGEPGGGEETTAALIGLALPGAMKYAPRLIPRPGIPEVQGPRATGEVLQTPEGAIPARLQPPAPPAPPAPLPRGRPVVPETPAQPRVHVLDEIRNAGARNIADIQNLFPDAKLNRERARALRDAAWGKPVETQRGTTPTEPEYAQTVRSDPEQVRPAGGEPQALQKEGRPDLEQPAPGRHEPVDTGKEETRPLSLAPALELASGEALTGGRSHTEVMQNAPEHKMEAALDAFAEGLGEDEPRHVFVDRTGKIYNRKEAAAVYDRMLGNPPGTTTELFSHHLEEHPGMVYDPASNSYRPKSPVPVEPVPAGKPAEVAIPQGRASNVPASEPVKTAPESKVPEHPPEHLTPERHTEITETAKAGGFEFDTMQAFPGIKPLLQFTFRNIPRSDPVYGATFNLPAHATRTEILERALYKAKEFAEAVNHPSAAAEHIQKLLDAEKAQAPKTTEPTVAKSATVEPAATPTKIEGTTKTVEPAPAQPPAEPAKPSTAAPEKPSKASDKSVRDLPVSGNRKGDVVTIAPKGSPEKLTFSASALANLTEFERKELLDKQTAHWDEQPGGAGQAARLRDSVRSVMRQLVDPKPSLQDRIDAQKKSAETTPPAPAEKPAAKLTPMMEQYQRIKEQMVKEGHGDSLLAYRLGDFYEFFFDDAKEASKHLKLTLTKRNGVDMAGIPFHAAQSYFGKLVSAGKKVAVVDTAGEATPGKMTERKVTSIMGEKPSDQPASKPAKTGYTQGQRVRMKLPSGDVEGSLAIYDNGRLAIRTDKGSEYPTTIGRFEAVEKQSSTPTEKSAAPAAAGDFLSVPEKDPGELKDTIAAQRKTVEALKKETDANAAAMKELEPKVLTQRGARWERGKIKKSAKKSDVNEYQELSNKNQRLWTAIHELEAQIRDQGKPVEIHNLQQRVNNPDVPLMGRLMARKELFYLEGGTPPDALLSQIRNEANRITLERYPDATPEELKAAENAVVRNASYGGKSEMDRAWDLDPELNIHGRRMDEVRTTLNKPVSDALHTDFSDALKADIEKYAPLYKTKPQENLSRAKADELKARIAKESEQVRAKRAVEAEAAAQAAAEMERKFTTTIESAPSVNGKDAKAKLIASLEKALAAAPEMGAGRAKVTVKIPGDGEFTIWNNKADVQHVLDEARKLETSKGGKFTPMKVRPQDRTDAQRAVEIYGSVSAAYQKLSGQLARAKDLGLSPEQIEGLRGTVNQLENTIREPWQKIRRKVIDQEGRTEFLAKQFGEKSQKVKEHLKNLEAAKAEEEIAKAEMERQLGTVPSKGGEGQVMGFGGGTIRRLKKIPALATTPQQLATIQRTMAPGLSLLGDIRKGLLSGLLPSAINAEHLNAAETLGAKLGAMARRAEASIHQLRSASYFFDRLGVHDERIPLDQNIGMRFASDMSAGRPMAPQLQKIADQVVSEFQSRLKKLEDAGAPIQRVRENYFPGLWTGESRRAFNAALKDAMDAGIIGKNFDPNTASPSQKAWIKERVDAVIESGTGSDEDMLQYFSRTPMKGKESFRKQKVFDDIMTGAEFGLRPVSRNPIDLVKVKLAEMDRSIMANEYFKELKQRGLLKVISPYDKTPHGWVRINDKYGTIYGKPTVTVPEWVDKAVYEGLEDFASELGIRHVRSMRFPSGPGSRALGLSYQGANLVRTKHATELSVLAHEIGHQIDHKYNLWKTIVSDAVGLGAKGKQTKAASQKMRAVVQKELRNIADLTGSRGGHERERPEQIAQMVEAYVHAPEKMKEVAPNVFKAFDDFIRSKPELAAMADIKPNIELKKLASEKYVGLPIMGYRIVPEAHGTIINNYLSSSLYNSPFLGALYKGWMSTANALNQTQLGLGSAFHAGFTTADVQVSAGANVMKDMYGVLRGNRSPADLAKTMTHWLGSSVRTAMTGDKVLNAWRHPDATMDPRIAQVVKAAELTGGGFKVEHGLQTEQNIKMMRDWFSGHRLRAAARSPVALTELMAKPIMEWLVPRQKAGVFAELANRIIDENPDKSLEQLTPEFRQAWNRVDARLGQVRYNRLFTQNVAKNFVQALVRAPGWTGGTIAEIGGAFPDTAKFFKEWYDTGKLPQNIPDRVAYTASLLITVGTVNALLTYLCTGQMPHGMDFLAFRTGRKDKDGNNERFLLPTYVKDLLAYSKQPGTTLLNKSHPLVTMMIDVLYRNQDYYGYEIRDPHASFAAQTGQSAKYVIKQFEPFWTRGVRKNLGTGTSAAATVAPLAGVMPATADITRTPVQNEISELYHLRTGERVRPYGTQESDAAKRAARQTGAMDVYMFKRLPQSDKDALLRKMTPKERQRYGGGMSAADAQSIRARYGAGP